MLHKLLMQHMIIGNGAGIRLVRMNAIQLRFCAGGSCVDSGLITDYAWHHMAGVFDKYNRAKAASGPRLFIMLDNDYSYTTIATNDFIQEKPFFFVGKWSE
jgi:hypothetical protein